MGKEMRTIAVPRLLRLGKAPEDMDKRFKQLRMTGEHSPDAIPEPDVRGIGQRQGQHVEKRLPNPRLRTEYGDGPVELQIGKHIFPALFFGSCARIRCDPVFK